MSPWSYVGRGGRTVRRLHDWQRLLGVHFLSWAPVLKKVPDPVGLRFFENFGSGELEFELRRDETGCVAIPVDGVTPQRLNATEAEFARVDLLDALAQIATAAGCSGAVEGVDDRHYALGRRSVAGRTVFVAVAPRGISPRKPQQPGASIAPGRFRADVTVLLVPDAAAIPHRQVQDLAAAKIAVCELPPSPPSKYKEIPRP